MLEPLDSDSVALVEALLGATRKLERSRAIRIILEVLLTRGSEFKERNDALAEVARRIGFEEVGT